MEIYDVYRLLLLQDRMDMDEDGQEKNVPQHVPLSGLI